MRVNGTNAIVNAKPCVVPFLIDNEKCGIIVNRKLFQEFHPWAVELYEQRNDSIVAMLWCMLKIGNGWRDVMYLTKNIMLNDRLSEPKKHQQQHWVNQIFYGVVAASILGIVWNILKKKS